MNKEEEVKKVGVSCTILYGTTILNDKDLIRSLYSYEGFSPYPYIPSNDFYTGLIIGSMF